MEKRIELEKRGRNPGEITEFVLDNCRSTNIVGLTDEFVALQTLSLINVGLTSLKGFPKLLNLRKLDLSDNRISGGLNLLHTSPKLTILNLSGNKIRDFATLQPLKDLKNLKSLDVFNNEATNMDNYREKVFNLIPSLRYLDGFDMEEYEVDESESDDDEVNGNDDGDGDANDDDSEEGISDEDDHVDFQDGGIALENVDKDDFGNDSDEEDYMGEESADTDDDEEEDDADGIWDYDEQDEEDAECATELESAPARGKKRKHEDVGESGN